MDINLQKHSDNGEVEALLDTSFGQDRHKKAAYSLREGVAAISELSFIIRKDSYLIATLRFWPVKLGKYDLLLLGPIAVLPSLQGKGYGITMMEYGLKQAKKLGHKRVILVGEESYYSRLGFSRKCAKSIIMPGQNDESRLLALELVAGSFFGIKGIISKYN
ncbi:MAG: N-acetyltransferase [Emcibacteraceae bacterium]|nr:N-acetyltransferase [Emcibacteraceae bacterium]